MTDEKPNVRPEAVARRRKSKQRTARENIADLFDEGSFIEYGALALAAQRTRPWIVRGLRSFAPPATRRRRFIDTW